MRQGGCRRRGLTLVDLMIGVVIIGISVPALMGAFSSGTQAHAASVQYTKAVHIAQNVREYALSLKHADPVTGLAGNHKGNSASFTNVCDMDGWSASPVDCTGAAIGGIYSGWTFTAAVKCVAAGNLDSIVADSAASPKRLTVQVKDHGAVIYTVSWILAPSQVEVAGG